jgi:hypothetical protein
MRTDGIPVLPSRIRFVAMLISSVVVKPGENARFDFKYKTFYYEIRAGKVVSVTVRQGRSWLKLR